MTTANSAPDKVYRRRFSPDSGESLALVAKQIGDGMRVLDVGCGAGDLGAYLQAEKGCSVVGMDYSAESVAVAGEKLDAVVQLDLNTQLIDEHVDGRFDVVVMADILEHIQQPEQALRSAEKVLKDNGKIIISIPNAGYVGALLSLYDDRWRYQEEGILDRTHVRFYTKQSVMELLDDSGFSGVVCDRVIRDLWDSEFTQRIDSQVDAVRDWLLAKPEGSTYQFIVEARPKSQQHVFTKEAPDVPMSIQHIVKCYWQESNDAVFNTERFTVVRGLMGRQNTLRFKVGKDVIQKVRIDFADRRSIYHLAEIAIFDGEEKRWLSKNNDYALSAHDYFSESNTLPLTAMAQNNAYVECQLTDVVSGDDLSVSVTMTAPVGEQNVAFADAVSLSQYQAAVADQKHLAAELSKLHTEANVRIEQLESALQQERQQLEQLIAEGEQQRQADELKQTAQLQEAQAYIQQLKTENSLYQQQLAEIKQSTSWKFSAPLRKLLEKGHD